MRKVFSILLLTVLFLAGSGLSYQYAIHRAHKNAENFAEAQFDNNFQSETLVLNADAYDKIHKRKISETVNEIVFEGKHYDIFNIQINADNTITLFVKMDADEMQINENYNRVNSENSGKIMQPPFYVFHFMPDAQILIPMSASLTLQFFTEQFSAISTNCCLVLSPPPEKMAA